MIVFCCGVTPLQRVVINGPNVCRGFVTVSSRSRVRHSTAEPLRLQGSDGRFNHVDPDHSKEWLNGTWTRAGGIVGNTKQHSQHSVDGLILIIYGLRL